MKGLQLLLWDYFLCIFFMLLSFYVCTFLRNWFCISVIAIGNIYYVSRILRGIMLLIDLKCDPMERNAVIQFAVMDKLDFFPGTKYHKIYLEDEGGKKIGTFMCFDDEIFDELHLEDAIHMHYYPRSRVIIKIEKGGGVIKTENT